MSPLREPEQSEIPKAGSVRELNLSEAPVPQVQETIPDGTEGPVATTSGVSRGDSAWEWFVRDAERQGLTITEYTKKYGIIKPGFDPFKFKEVTFSPDIMERMIDSVGDEYD